MDLQSAFDLVFSQYDPDGLGKIKTRDFLKFIDGLEQILHDDPNNLIMSEQQRIGAQGVVDADFEMTRSEVVSFLEELGFDLSSAAPQASAHRESKEPRVSTSKLLATDVPPDFSFDIDNVEPPTLINPLAQSTPNRVMYSSVRPSVARPHREIRARPLSANQDYAAKSQSPNSNASEAMSYSEEELHSRTDLVKSFQDRMRNMEKTIAGYEAHIHDLSNELSKCQQELGTSSRTASELQSATESFLKTIERLERNLEAKGNEITRLSVLHTGTKSDLEKALIRLDVAESKYADLLAVHNAAEARAGPRNSELNQLKRSCVELEEELHNARLEGEKTRHLEIKLEDALQACQHWEAQVEELRHDAETMRLSSIRSQCTRQHVASSEENEAESNTKVSERYVKADANNLSPTENASMARQYAVLSDELGLQRNLIDQMIKMKPGKRRTKRVAGKSSILFGSAPDSESLRFNASPMTWTIIVLYSFLFLMLGYLVAYAMNSNALGGITYAESRAWNTANSLGRSIELDGLYSMIHRGRWWEGGWLWVELLGYWLEDKLIDSTWPS